MEDETFQYHLHQPSLVCSPEMSDNRRQNRNYGNGRDRGDKRPRELPRGPASIDSHTADIYDLQKLRYPPSNHIHELSFRKIRVSHAEDFILSRNAPICKLELLELDFQQLSELPRDLIAFIETSSTLQELVLDWTDFTDAQWDSIARAAGRNANIRKCTVLNDRARLEVLQPIIQLPRLEELVLGSFMIRQSELEGLIAHPTLRTLELRRVRTDMPLSDDTIASITAKPTLVSQLLVQEPKDESTIAQWTKLQNAIIQRAINASSTRPRTIYTKDGSSLEATLNVIGISLNQGDAGQVSTEASNSLPAGIFASIPSATSAVYDFNASKHELIVVELPSLARGALLSEYVVMVMTLLIQAFHHLEQDGKLLVLDTANVNLTDSDADFRVALEMVCDEMVKRVDAFFDTFRVGVWKTSRDIQERIFILKSGAQAPVVAPENPSSSAASNPSSHQVWCWKKVATSLSREYGRFLLSHALFSWWGSDLNFNNRREVQAILEQWFMLRANGEDADRYPVEELVKKHVCDRREAEKWVEFCTRQSLIVPTVPEDLVPRSEETPTRGVSMLSIGQFQETLQTSRVDALLQAATRHGSSRPLDDLLSMMLRYGTVFGNFRQYSTNDTLFQELVDAGVDCEGFASPFNAQILLSTAPPLIGKTDAERTKLENWSPKFGSCYEDTDGIFGSIGSFFHLSFFDHDHIFLNPPTVEAVLSRTMHFIHEQLRLRPCQFHVLIPAWDDLEAYQVGIASKYLTRNRSINSQEFPSQNPYTGERKPSNKKFALLSFSSEPR